MQSALCEELGLGVPVSTRHVVRDGFAEVLNFLALVTGSLGKIALDIMIMASTEFAEVYEPFVKGRGASSTLPQKRNPISSELMLAAAKAVRQHAGASCWMLQFRISSARPVRGMPNGSRSPRASC